MTTSTSPSLLGRCPACNRNLDAGGNEDCETCAGEPRCVEVVRMDRPGLMVVTVADIDPSITSTKILDYLSARFPRHRALPNNHGDYVSSNAQGWVVVLDHAIVG